MPSDPQVEYSSNPNYCKKKNSLLKRTASEPRLNKFEDHSTFEISLVSPEEKPQLKKSFKEDPITKKLQKAKKIQASQEDDSPYNEIFFYHFENELVDYLDKKIQINKIK